MAKNTEWLMFVMETGIQGKPAEHRRNAKRWLRSSGESWKVMHIILGGPVIGVYTLRN